MFTSLLLATLLSAASAAAACSAINGTLLTMGEAMLRMQPIDSAAAAPSPTRHLPQPFLRSVGGDELNVAVASSLVGVTSRWISVLPTGPMGDVITDSATHHNVEFAGKRVEGDLGFFTVLPELRRVHYQRRNAVFATHDPAWLDWAQLLDAERPWLHMTGITPLISSAAQESWANAMRHAVKQGIPISLDLNHRKQLGTLDELWTAVRPHAAYLQLLILSTEQLEGLASIELGDAHTPSTADADSHHQSQEGDARILSLMATLQKRWKCRRVALCRKTRDAAGLQRRWSLMTVLDGATIEEVSTHELPVWHVPIDDLGGGSAWAAGMIHALHFAPLEAPREVLRRADLLSALCQQTAGDFSAVTSEELAATESTFAGRPARLPGTPPEPTSDGMAALPSPKPLPSREVAEAAIEETLRGLKRAGVLAILRVRGPSASAAIARGVELAAMGCDAIEVTLDSTDWPAIVRGLRAELPSHVMLGVGTVMDETVSEVALAASLGATFALSPIEPVGFIEECHRRGVLAIPSAFTSNEWYALHRKGARIIKLFHAGLVSPSILKSMLGVTPLGEQMAIMPSGGVSPSNAADWWSAGAVVVGMGSNLVGSDINHAPGTEKHAAAAAKWVESGRELAQNVFDQARARAAVPARST